MKPQRDSRNKLIWGGDHSGARGGNNRRRHRQEQVQRYTRMLQMISSMRLLQTEDPDRANDIHNLGGNLNTPSVGEPK